MLVTKATIKGVLHIKLALLVLHYYFPFFVYFGFIGRVWDGLRSHALAVISLAVSSSTCATKSNEIAENKQR